MALKSWFTIISKLEVLFTSQKNLKTHLLGIEKKLNDDNKKNNTMDPDYIKVIKDEYYLM